MTPMPNHCNECDKPVVDWDEHARICAEFSSEEANQLLGFLKNRDKFVTFEVLEPFNWKEISTEIEDQFLQRYGKEISVRIREYDTSHLKKGKIK